MTEMRDWFSQSLDESKRKGLAGKICITGYRQLSEFRQQKKENKKMAVITITKDNFENGVLGAKLPVVLDFWAEWCAPCRMQSPVIEALAEELDGKVIFGKVNVDEEAALALKYQIMSIPTLVVMKYGLFRNRAVGLQTREEIIDMIEQIKED